jgi:osmotically-inducible protein OsmY
LESRLNVQPPAMVRPDDHLWNEILAALRWNLLVDHQRVRVDVNDGKVRLRGIVISDAEKVEVLTDVRLAGVASVDGSGLRVDRSSSYGEFRTDRYAPKEDGDVAEAVRIALGLDPRVDVARVKVTVERGVVTLGGVVESQKARLAAGTDARNTVGAAWVRNRLQVLPTNRADAEQ